MATSAANGGEDDGSSAGESSSGDNSSDNKSGNSGLKRYQSGRSSLFSISDNNNGVPQTCQKSKRLDFDAVSEKSNLQAQGKKVVKKVKYHRLTVKDSKPKKKSSGMTRPVSGYSDTFRLQCLRDDFEPSWTPNVENLNLEMHPLLSPRGATRVNKLLNGSSRTSTRSRMNVELGIEESGDDSETSTSSYTSSCSSNSPTKSVGFRTRSSSLSAADRWKNHVVSSHQSHEPREELPLLASCQDLELDVAPGILLESDVENDFYPNTKAEIWKLVTLAYPVTFTYVLEFFPELVSMMLVGHLDSPLTKQYLDGVALSSMCINLTAIGVGFGLATAMDTLCSQAYGAGKLKKLGIYLQSGFIVLSIAMIPVFVVNWYTEALLLMIGQPPQVAKFAGRFSRILLPGIPAMYVYEMVKKVMQAQNIVLPMVYIAIISNCVNLLVGVYLTFFTSLGFDGAAIARLLSEVVLPVCLLPYFMRNPRQLAKWWPGWQATEAVQRLGIFLRLGLPGAAMMLLEWWSFEMMAAFVGLLPNSVVAISVHSVLVNVSTFAFNFFLGISVAANVLVGNYLGKNQPLHAKMASFLGMLLSVSLSAVIAVIIISTRYLLPKIFINDVVSIEKAGHALLVLMPYQLCDALNAVMQGVFRGTGRLMLGAYINLIAYFVIGLPCGIFLAFRMKWGVEGLWLGLTLGIIVGCGVSFVKIFKTNWRKMADAARVRTS